METLSASEILNLISFDRLPLVVIEVLVFWFGLSLLTRLAENLGERFTQHRLLLKKLQALVRFAGYVILGFLVPYTMLRGEGQDVIIPLFATLGFGLGFALKDLVASWMAGLLLIFDEPFQVGDRVSFGDYYGEVSAIGLRSVRLITLDDSLVTIPNSKFLTDAVSSGNAGALDMMVVVPFYVSASEDFERARRILYEVACTSVYVFLNKPVVTTISDQFLGERFCSVINVKAYVFDTRYEKAFVSDITERAKRAFRHEDIRTPDLAYRDLDIHGRDIPREAGMYP